MNFYTTPPHSPEFLRKSALPAYTNQIFLYWSAPWLRSKQERGGKCFANVQLFSEIYAKNLEKSLVISNFGCLCLSKKE